MFCSCSIAPLPARVGMSVAAVAPQSKAKSSERAAHSRDSSSRMKGGWTRMKTRRPMLFWLRKSAARAKSSRVMRLLSLCEDLRVDGFEAHCYFESPGEQNAGVLRCAQNDRLQVMRFCQFTFELQTGVPEARGGTRR